MNFVYLAYGTNMPSSIMKKHKIGSRGGLKFLGVGWLNDMRLAFGSGGYATILEAKGRRVPVCAYRVEFEELTILDYYEGSPTYYERVDIEFEPDNIAEWGEKYPEFPILSNGNVLGKVYIMAPGHQVMTANYVADTLARKGYEEYGIDVKYLDEAIEWSNNNRGLLIERNKDYGDCGEKDYGND